MPLNNDTSRCHDSGCSDKGTCLRWIERNAKGDRIMHSHSLFPDDTPLSDPCPMKIVDNEG